MYNVINPDGTSMKFDSLGEAFIYDVQNGCKGEIVGANYKMAYDEPIRYVISGPLARLPYQYELHMILLGLSRGNIDDIGWAEAVNAAHIILEREPIDEKSLEDAASGADTAVEVAYKAIEDEEVAKKVALLINCLYALLDFARSDELDYRKPLEYREKIKNIIGAY